MERPAPRRRLRPPSGRVRSPLSRLGSPVPVPAAGWPCRTRPHRRSKPTLPSCRFAQSPAPSGSGRFPSSCRWYTLLCPGTGGAPGRYRPCSRTARRRPVRRFAPGQSGSGRRRGQGPPRTTLRQPSFHLQSGVKGRSATAKVTPFRAHLCAHTGPPAASTAARSQTLSTPVMLCTKSE